ncbi:carboxypeptidase-like regulatory domain-containing protein [Chitinophaga filiformis]|uniref:carboxypeptidase-like regulatory domain-containing protein n=1 Tax=Chitinophaga filiformis TaxID=104663 RepID=UPI001F3C59A3|nr:carboxypeptidase-like regulatory domain-containing protein [Chitinophaga filiformis]MCF6405327.1 carboxypeptidase-like regulatory domain-containing protein [Chitinophaga filiformis]
MKNIVLLSFLLCLTMACIKEGPPGPKGPDGPPFAWPPAQITGYIELYDQLGGLMARADSVLLHTYNADSMFSVYTDSSGHFRLHQLPPGNYDISISKPGFDSLHMYVQHAGGALDKFTGVTGMSEHVTTKLLSVTVHPQHVGSLFVIDVDIVFQWPQPFIADKVTFTAFLDTSSTPGSGRALSTFFLSDFPTDIDGINGTAHGRFRLPDSLVTSGTDFYVTVVVMPPYTARRSWFNYATGAQIPYPYPGDSIKAHSTQTE